MQISQYLNIYIYGTIPTGFYDDLGTHRVHIGLRTGTHPNSGYTLSRKKSNQLLRRICTKYTHCVPVHITSTARVCIFSQYWKFLVASTRKIGKKTQFCVEFVPISTRYFYSESMLDTTQHKWTPAASVEIMVLAVLCRTKSSADRT